MKDESSLDAAGPLAIVGFLLLVLVIATWIMLSYQGDWGSGTPAPESAQETAEAAH